ncbi:tagatose-6-phosphate kinase [Collibacillus ludicampi]|uniref:Tagatose-6-phosphate kinase n=1 Tax=Collibacillus ludicampi TaxID=2771369 RepID=A0AAV4LJD6_9BACL|nr:1-phosphofructokinase [Collibacillus ludicampi]GIM47977.1 tagatose-6-phosphate kinase [Collibacillus ludicampi]
MITTVVLNPAIDVRYSIDRFELNKSHRCTHYQKTAGGKGLNVSRVLRILGDDVRATGFLGGNSGEFIAGELHRLAIENRFVRIDEETRTCIAILSKDLTQTEILESGPFIKKEFVDQFLTLYRKLLDDTTVISASGSLPRGLEDDFYSLLIEEAHKKRVKFVLDTSGLPLKKAIQARPFLIKPNQTELEQLCGKKLSSEEDVIQQACELYFAGVENVLVSLGAAGAILVNREGVFKARIPKIQAINPVGSGDSMVAGFVHAISAHSDWEHALRYACACGVANAMEEETGKVNAETVREVLKKIDVFGAVSK